MYAFLDRVDSVYWARVRDLLNDWFSRLPCGMRDDVSARWRSGDNGQAQAAFWEMYLFEAHRRAGYEVEPHPEIAGEDKRPDFLVTRREDGASFYLEATMASRWSDADAADERRRRAIFERIDTALDSPNFFLEIRFEREGAELPSDVELVRPLSAWLQTLDPDEVGERLKAASRLAKIPMCVVEARGWIIRLRAVPKKVEARGGTGRPLGVFPGKAGVVDEQAPIVSALRRKATRYGELDRPYVVAVLVDRVFADEEDVAEALFAKVQLALDGESQLLSGEPMREPQSLWRRGNTPRNTRVSAVLSAIHLSSHVVARSMPRLWHNPWARRPIEVDLPWPATMVDLSTGEMTRSGAHVEPLRLPADWPGPEEPFPRHRR